MSRVPLKSVSIALLMIVLTGCGGTWVDDEGNFNRVFGFSKPEDVKVIHSYYWKSPHWTTEYRYFIAFKASPNFVKGLTAPGLMTGVESEIKHLESCGVRPQWFLPQPLTSYEVWVPNTTVGYRVFRDKSDGTLFLCDQRL